MYQRDRSLTVTSLAAAGVTTSGREARARRLIDQRPVSSRQQGGCLFLARARASSAIAEGLQQAPPPATEPPWHLLHAQHFLLTYQY